MLRQNYPNPFNPETIINYQLPKKVFVKISLFNMCGQRVRILNDAVREVSYHNISWNGCDEFGDKVVS